MKAFAFPLFAAALVAAAPGWAQHILPPGTHMNTYNNGQITSPGGRYRLSQEFVFGSGGSWNLVMRRPDGSMRWSPGVSATDVYMQLDGNFVTYGFGKPTWNTATWGNPGAYLAIQDDGNLVVYSASGQPLWNIGVDNYGYQNPREVGDIVGRDLDIELVGALGHVGLWDGREVAEVMSSRANAAQFTALASFQTATSYWGAVSMPIPSGRTQEHCFRTYCDPRNDRHYERVETRIAAARRARMVQAIGADYTLFPENTRGAYAARPGDPGRRGLYRCDTYVADLLLYTTYYDAPNREQRRWRDFVSKLAAPPVLPRTLYERAASYR